MPMNPRSEVIAVRGSTKGEVTEVAGPGEQQMVTCDAVTSTVTNWRSAQPRPRVLASTALFDPPRRHWQSAFAWEQPIAVPEAPNGGADADDFGLQVIDTICRLLA